MALQFQIIPVTSFSQNCSILWCDESMQGIVVDPGGDVEHIIAVINELSVHVIKIVLTHGHLDHVGGTTALTGMLNNIDVIGPHQADLFWLQDLKKQCEMFGFPLTSPFEPNQWLDDGDCIKFGNQRVDVIHTPGHTPGHITLFSAEAKLAIVGDVLFNGSIGRTDFPQGNLDTLMHSIKHKLWPLGNDVTFVPGHGPTSTFGKERRSNPYVADEMPLY